MGSKQRSTKAFLLPGVPVTLILQEKAEKMEETTFTADPMRLMLAAAVGIVILLVLIIKFKLHPVLSMMISAIIIGAGAGMPLEMIADTVEKGVGKTLQGIALLVGLGSMFGGILEVSGSAQRMAETLISKFGQKKAGWALGLTGLVIGTTVFFEAGVVVLIPLVFSVAKQTKKSTLYYAIPLLSGLASGYAFVPPSAGSVLVANALGVNLGTMIMVGVPTALICMLVSGIIWGNLVGNKIFTELPANVEEIKDDGKELPPFGLVLGVILIPLVLILLSTVSKYMPIPAGIQSFLGFIGKPFLALTIATLAAMYFLGIRRGFTGAQLKKILDHSLRPVGMILLVIASGGVIRWMLQDSGLGNIIGPALEKSGLPLKRFFNTSGNIYKEMKLKDKLPEMSEEEQLALLATDGMLVKRPILVGKDKVLVGAKEKEWEEYLKS